MKDINESKRKLLLTKLRRTISPLMKSFSDEIKNQNSNSSFVNSPNPIPKQSNKLEIIQSVKRNNLD